MTNLWLILIAVFFVLLSGLFSGAETGMYRLSRIRLRLGIEKNLLPYVILGRCLHDSSGLLISILAGTNLANYLATSIITYMFLCKLGTEHTAELAATIIMSPVLFIFAELIPKSLFFYRADTLMPPVAPVMFIFHKFLTYSGMVVLFKKLSQTFTHLAGMKMPSQIRPGVFKEHQITAILNDTQQEDILSSVQINIISRLAVISSMRIRRVMVPIGRVRMIEQNSGREILLKKLQQSAFTRFLVYSQVRTNIVGFINIYDCLCSTEKYSDLSGFTKPVRRLSAETSVYDTITIMQREKHKIVLVVKPVATEREKPVGIVTMKDLVEELLGELAQW